MDKTNEQKEILVKILQSECFQGKDLYRDLLVYLVEASLKGKTPKEVTIALDVFHKDKDFNAAENTTVRVHMHKLRKMLEQYYQTEGKTEKIKLFIPKGHYKVKFRTESKPEKFLKESRQKLTNITLMVLLALLLLYLGIDKIVLNNNIKFTGSINDKALWGEFFKNGYPTSIVIGDFLIFHEYDSELHKSRRIQDYDINTVDELTAYIARYQERNPETFSLGELPHNSLFNILDLQRVFLSYHKKANIDFSSEIDINYIKNKNIIYIGEFKNLRALSNLTSALPITYQTLPWWHGTISFHRNDSLITLNTYHDWSVNRYVVDLGMIAKLPGENRENYLFFAGIGYNAQIKIVEIFCNNVSLNELESQILRVNGSIPDYYVMVFEIKGFDRASTKAELKFFKEIGSLHQ